MPPLPRSPYICSSCLKRTSLISQRGRIRYTSTATEVAISPPSATAPLSSRRLISLYGQDAPKYLQGLITANVPRPSTSSSAGFYAAFLNASGRVLHDVFIYPTQHSKQWRNAVSEREQEGGFLIEVDTKDVETLYGHLKRYKLRANIGIRIVDEGEWMPWASWGESQVRAEIMSGDERVPGAKMGARAILHYKTKPEVDADGLSSPEYNLRRIMMGVPEGQDEIVRESALPQESNIDYMRGIDFRKGCYVGQELTIRTHHTGVVRKRILPVQLYDEDEQEPETLRLDGNTKVTLPAHGSNIGRVDKRGRSAGKWLTGIGNVGLALCRLDVMTDTALTGEGSQWSPGAEFKVLQGESAPDRRKGPKVKAFVPGWHKERAETQEVQRPNG